MPRRPSGPYRPIPKCDVPNSDDCQRIIDTERPGAIYGGCASAIDGILRLGIYEGGSPGEDVTLAFKRRDELLSPLAKK